jgi:hypothetical protein
MLAEMMLRGDSTRHWGRNTGGGENAHQLPYDLAKTAQSPDGDGSVKKRSKLRYVPNPHEGIPQPDFSAGRFTSTVSIRPAHSKRSTVRMGFSGHAPGPSEKVERCRALDDLATKRLVDTPVIVSEGVLKEARGINILRTAGEFPHRDRVPLDEKIRYGKEINRKPDTLPITKAGGFTWDLPKTFSPFSPFSLAKTPSSSFDSTSNTHTHPHLPHLPHPGYHQRHQCPLRQQRRCEAIPEGANKAFHRTLYLLLPALRSGG